MSKTALGHIDCPTCGKADAMRITSDRNGDPFGFCEDGCGQQLRIGGKPARVRAFLARFPWAAGASVTVTVPLQEKPADRTPVAAPVPAPAPVPAAAKPAPTTKAPPAAKPAAPAPAPAKKTPWFQPIMGGA